MATPDPSRKYVIVRAADLHLINFAEMLEDEMYLRYSNDGSLVVLKYEGSMPASVSALRPTEYTYAEITTEMETADWLIDEEAGLYD